MEYFIRFFLIYLLYFYTLRKSVFWWTWPMLTGFMCIQTYPLTQSLAKRLAISFQRDWSLFMIGTDRGKGGGEGSENILMCRGRQKGIEKPRMGIGIFISKKFAYNIFVPIELCQLCSPRVGKIIGWCWVGRKMFCLHAEWASGKNFP